MSPGMVPSPKEETSYHMTCSSSHHTFNFTVSHILKFHATVQRNLYYRSMLKVMGQM